MLWSCQTDSNYAVKRRHKHPKLNRNRSQQRPAAPFRSSPAKRTSASFVFWRDPTGMEDHGSVAECSWPNWTVRYHTMSNQKDWKPRSELEARSRVAMFKHKGLWFDRLTDLELVSSPSASRLGLVQNWYLPTIDTCEKTGRFQVPRTRLLIWRHRTGQQSHSFKFANVQLCWIQHINYIENVQPIALGMLATFQCGNLPQCYLNIS